MHQIWTFIFILYVAVQANGDTKCINLEISLTQKVENEGFHREIRWLLERNATPSCSLIIQLIVSKELFVNPDQIADLNRIGQLAVYIKGEVDVEVAAHSATEHTVYVFIPENQQKVSINLPFHLRYQRSQISGGFGKAVINKPIVLANCPNACGNIEVEAPCDVSGESKCRWRNVTYQALFDEVELLVPIGDLDAYPLVSIVTLLLGCAGCIYILSVLSTTPL